VTCTGRIALPPLEERRLVEHDDFDLQPCVINHLLNGFNDRPVVGG
jgi:hypothetical protein